MKYRIIKKVINSIYTLFDRVHCEIEKITLEESLGKFGKGSYIDMPILSIDSPEKVFIGSGTYICQGARLDVHEGEDGRDNVITIGDNCYIAYNFTIISNGKVELGDNVLIASNVSVISEHHGINPNCNNEYMHQHLIPADVTIKSGTYIGEKTIILPNISIGRGCVIGAGSVVTRSIPDYSIAVGNPAQIIKRFSFETNEWERFK